MNQTIKSQSNQIYSYTSLKSLIDARGEISHQDLSQHDPSQQQNYQRPFRMVAQNELKTSDV